MSQLRTGPRHCYLDRPKPQAGEAEAYCGKALTPCRHVAAHICAVSLLMPCLRLGSALLSWRAAEAEMERERERYFGATGQLVRTPNPGRRSSGTAMGCKPALIAAVSLSLSRMGLCLGTRSPIYVGEAVGPLL